MSSNIPILSKIVMDQYFLNIMLPVLEVNNTVPLVTTLHGGILNRCIVCISTGEEVWSHAFV